MGVHYTSYREALQEVGVSLDKGQFYRQAGMTGREQIMYFCDKARVLVDVEQVYARKTVLARKYIDQASPIPSNIELLRLLRSSGIPVALASGSSRPSIVPMMQQFGIEVDALATSEDVERGKPSPDLFLYAAGCLGVEPRNCIVVEDSDVGIEAASNAGMRSLRYFGTPKPD